MAVPATVRLALGLRRAAGRRARRPVQRALRRCHPHQADVPARLEHPGDPVPRRELGRRGRRLHGPAGAQRTRDTAAGAHRAGRPGAGARPDPLRTGLRLRPGPHGGRHRRGGRGVLLLAGGPAGAEVDGAAAGRGLGRRRRPRSRGGGAAGAVPVAAGLDAAAGPGRGRGPAREHPGVLAALDQEVAVPRPLPGDGRTFGPGPEAAGPPAHRRARGRAPPRRCPSPSAAAATGTTASRGSATRPSPSTR